MKFNELEKGSQMKAVADYIEGWKETHQNETFSYEEAYNLCKDSNEDVEFNELGEQL